jgi:hypothetical protein
MKDGSEAEKSYIETLEKQRDSKDCVRQFPIGICSRPLGLLILKTLHWLMQETLHIMYPGLL